MDAVTKIAHETKQSLFIGEFNDDLSNSTGSPFATSVINKIKELSISYSTLMAWEFYHFNTYSPDPTRNLEPGASNNLIAQVRSANQALGNSIYQPPPVDQTPPHVVITWPFEGVSNPSANFVYVVASDNTLLPPKVVLSVDGKQVGTLLNPPYKFAYDLLGLSRQNHTFQARAFDATGNSATYTTVIYAK